MVLPEPSSPSSTTRLPRTGRSCLWSRVCCAIFSNPFFPIQYAHQDSVYAKKSKGNARCPRPLQLPNTLTIFPFKGPDCRLLLILLLHKAESFHRSSRRPRPDGGIQAVRVSTGAGVLSSPPAYTFFSRAKLAMIFLVPTFSKAISTRVSLPIGVADRTIPWPNTL